MNQNLYSPITFLLVMFLMGSQLLNGANITVMNTNDAGAGSLRQAVLDAIAGDCINFDAATDGVPILLSTEIVIDKMLNIVGNGAGITTISGDNNSRIFNITNAGDVSLTDMSLIDGAEVDGGAIFNSNTNLTITDAMLTGNDATGAAGSGGAIFHEGLGSDLNVINTTLSGNTAMRAGGAVETRGGTMTIFTNSTLDGNMASANPGNGGGLHITGNGSLNFMSSTAINNIAASEGGGLWNGTGFMMLVESTLSNNTAQGDAADNGGGGLFNAGGTISVMTNSMIFNNMATGAAGSGGGIFNDASGFMVVKNATVSGNSSIRAGGGIEATGGTTNTITDATISNNTTGAAPGNGGGMHITGAGNATVTGGTVNSNTAASEGGGLWNGTGMMTIDGVTIASNVANGVDATNGGGGVFNAGGMVTINNGTIITNNAAAGASGSGGGVFNDAGGTVNIENAEITVNNSMRAGGGIEATAGTTTNLTNVLLNSNTTGAVPGNGGGMHITGAGNATVTGGTVNSNTAASEGGGLWNGSGMMTVDGVTIASNVANGADATNGGGGVFNAGGMVTINNGTIITNNAAAGASGSGGGVFNDAGGTIDISNAEITVNNSMRAGGGIEATAGTTTNLTNVLLNSNTTGAAPGNGGGMHITGAGNATITGGTINSNTAAREGGGLWNGSGMMTVDGVTIASNVANGPAADDGGGGIFNNGGTVTVQNGTVITANAATGAAGSGGGILNFAMGILMVDNSTISNNTSVRAGGGIEATENTMNTLNNVSLNANTTAASPGNGGGMHITGAGNADITGGTVNANVAASEGGGLWNGTGIMTITGTLINSNIASGAAADNGGGGVFNAGGTINISGATISANVANGASGSGGGILNDAGGMVFIDNSTISDNNSMRAGGGIEATGGTTTTLTNVLLNVNTTASSPGNGGGMHITGAGNAIITGGTVNSNTAASEGGGLWNGTGMMTIDNVFIGSNTAQGAAADNGGGGVFNAGGIVSILNGTNINNNTATGASGSGGGILNDAGGTVSVENSLIVNNTSNRAGGGIEATGGTTTNLTNVELNVNTTGAAPGNGGGMHITGDGNANITGGLVNSNNAASEGGGLWNGTGMMNISGVTIAANVANGAAADNGGGAIFNAGGMVFISNGTVITANIAGGASGSGGGILNDAGGTVDVNGGLIVNNVSSRAGGGIEATGGTTTNLTNVELNSNTTAAAPGNGGGMHISGDGNANITGGLVNSNNAASEGGGLWNGTGMMNIDGVVIASNNANGADATNGGGGVFNAGGMVNITGGTIITANNANGASGSGGGVFNDAGGTVSIENSEITVNNSMRAGGGIEATVGTTTNLTNVLLNSNTTGAAPGNGGGMHITGAGNANIMGGTVNSNTAAREGGGLWNGSGVMTVDGVVIASNAANGAAADDGGGGIFNNGGTLIVQNGTVVTNNSATTGSGSGGGMFSNGGMVTVTSSTISNNTANRAGGGVEVTGGMFNLMDVDLISNVVNNSPGNGGGLHITGAATVNVDESRVNNNSAGNEGGGLWGSGAGTLSVSGSTVRDNNAPDGGGLFLQAGSGMLNTVNSTVSGNHATNGAGVQVEGGTFNTQSTTIASNTATGNGGGVNVVSGSVFSVNTIIGDNSGANCPDFNGAFAMAMNTLLENGTNTTGIMDGVNGNIVGFDPMLNPLANNGGNTLTHLPMGTSPALDRGSISGLALDQRLANRVAVTTEDIGAVELQVGQLSNDVCAGAAMINCSELLFGTTETATAADAPAACSPDTDTQAGVWFTFIGNGQVMGVSTDNPGTNFDTEINIYSGTCGNLFCESADDNSGANGTSTVGVTTTNGTTYYVYVDGENGATGQFQLSLTCCDVPVAACQSTTVFLDANTGTATLTPADIDAGSSAPCGLGSLSVLPSTVVCGNVPTALATLTVTDIFGISDQCQVTINVVDNVNPDLVCQDATVVLDAMGLGSITEADVIVNNFDACGIASTSINKTDFDCDDIGVNVLTIISIDNNGNVSTCNPIVTVVDDAAAVIGCRPTIHTISDEDICGIADLIVLEPLTLQENCSVVFSNNAPSIFPVGETVITWTATDAGGNETTCEQLVLIQDATPPVIDCGEPFVAEVTETLCSFPSSLLDPTTATDNCGIVSITSDAPFSFGPGNYMVNFVATDAAGNEATCMQWVKIKDFIAPAILTCPENIVVEATETDGSAQAFFSTPTAIDNCGPITLVESNFESGDFFPLGDTEVIYTFYDGMGNPSDCSFLVTVTPDDPLISLVCLEDLAISNTENQVWNQIGWNPPLMTTECEDCEILESEDYEFIGSLSGHQYYVYTGEDLTWQEANEFAENLGAYLVVIDNEKEEVMLQNEIEDGTYFTGLVDMEGLGEFDWTTDGEIDEEIFEDLTNDSELPATVILDEEDKWTVVNLEETFGKFIFEFNCINMEMVAEVPNEIDETFPPTQVEGDDELAPGTTAQVTYTIEDQCGNVASCGFDVAISEAAVDYCASSGIASDEENPFWIESFQMGDIVVPSGQDEGYGDMTENTFVLTAGQDVQLGAIFGPENNELPLYCRIWIDLNNDGDFFDENEMWMQGVDFDVMSAEAVVPETLVEGTRLRIAIARLTYPESCGDFMDGEVEDYTVTIVEPETDEFIGGFNDTNVGNSMGVALNIFPNPASDRVTVEIQNIEEDTATLEVYNSLGQLMMTQNLAQAKNQSLKLNITDYSDGMYTILIHGQDGLELAKKFVKDKTSLRP